MSTVDTYQIESERIFPNSKPKEQAVSLSLLDATTVDFSTTSVIWLCERPDAQGDGFDLSDHLRQSLKIALCAYPQWTGFLKGISELNPDKLPCETAHFEPHARRYGRIYAHFGTPQDPGVEFVTARSTATLDDLCPISRIIDEPIYDRQKVSLANLVPSTGIANAFQTNSANEAGLLLPLMAIQLTYLSCGGFTLAAKIGHPMADIQSLVSFAKDWASVSRWILSGSRGGPPEFEPIFEPGQLDQMASGDINAKHPDPLILKQIARLPLHRFDWWASTDGCPWEALVPDEYRNKENPPAGKSMPWSEWDSESPVLHYIIHLDREQVELIWKDAVRGSSHETGALKISRHDAVLAHTWACVARARNLHEDSDPIHCDLTYGARGVFGFNANFVGSPSMMINIEMSGAELASPKITEEKRRSSVSQTIRRTINQINRPAAIGAHLHSVAYETCPQRIWQAFLGRRHILVTSWARAGVYEIDFGLSSSSMIRYAEPVMADMDGIIVIKEGPPSVELDMWNAQSWTDNGVDISIHIRKEDMERLIQDPLLLPQGKKEMQFR